MSTFYKIYIPFFMLMICTSMLAQKTSSKTINKTYKLTNSGELYLENKYGNININGWDKEEIQITIDIEVTNKKSDDADEILDRIQPKFRTTDNYANVISEITEKSTSFFAKYFNKINPLDIEKSNISINYTINLPANADIEIINKFGDIILNNWTGKLQVAQKHGDIWINESISNADIDLKYGKLKTKSIDYGRIDLKNGNIELDKAKYLSLKTSGTTIKINRIDKLDFTSNKDDAEFNYIGETKADLKFSSVLIREIDNDAFFNTKITDLEVSSINEPDSKIEINQVSSDITVNISNISFVFESYLEQGVLKLPKSFKEIDTNIIDDGKKIREITASYGNIKKGIFSVTGKKGTITLTE